MPDSLGGGGVELCFYLLINNICHDVNCFLLEALLFAYYLFCLSEKHL